MNANQTQVGGTHYRATTQHWDLVARLNLDYFTGNITKYVVRYKLKNGRQDLDKALHYLKKLIEVVRRGNHDINRKYYNAGPVLQTFFGANELDNEQRRFVSLACNWCTTEELVLLEYDLMHLIKRAYPEATPGGLPWPKDAGEAPGASYVNQDQGHG